MTARNTGEREGGGVEWSAAQRRGGRQGKRGSKDVAASAVGTTSSKRVGGPAERCAADAIDRIPVRKIAKSDKNSDSERCMTSTRLQQREIYEQQQRARNAVGKSAAGRAQRGEGRGGVGSALRLLVRLIL